MLIGFKRMKVMLQKKKTLTVYHMGKRQINWKQFLNAMHIVKTLSHLFKHKLPCVPRVTVPICTYQVQYINIHTIGNQNQSNKSMAMEIRLSKVGMNEGEKAWVYKA